MNEVLSQAYNALSRAYGALSWVLECVTGFDKIKAFQEAACVGWNGVPKRNHYISLYRHASKCFYKVKKVPVPAFDDTFSPDGSYNVEFSQYYHILVNLYFIHYGMSLFLAKNGTPKACQKEKNDERLQFLQSRIYDCLKVIPEKYKTLKRPLLDFKDPWYDTRLEAFDHFVMSGECPTEFFAFELWWFHKRHNSYRIMPDDDTYLTKRDALALFCAYAGSTDGQIMLQKNVNDYIISYFKLFKEHGPIYAKDNAGFKGLLYNTRSYQPGYDTRVYSTIQSVDELSTLLTIASTVHYPLFLNKERTELVITHKDGLERLINFKRLVDSSLEEQKAEPDYSISESFRKLLFSVDLKYLRQWPSIPFILYWSIQHLDFMVFRKQFLVDANEPEGTTTTIETDFGLKVNVRTWKQSDLLEIKLKKFRDKDALERLQLIFFFAIFDATKDLTKELYNMNCPEEVPYDWNLLKEYILSIKNGTWSNPAKQTELFNKISERSLKIKALGENEVNLLNFKNHGYSPTELAIVLIFSMVAYARGGKDSPHLSLINLIDELRKKTFLYYNIKKKDLKNDQDHVTWLNEVQKMEAIDCGYPITLNQLSPTFVSEYFQRDVMCRIFHDTDAKLSYLDESGKNAINYTNEVFYGNFYRCLMNNVYLNEERNMETHYSKFKCTETLLDKGNCIDLLLVLFDLKKSYSNRVRLRACVDELDTSFIERLNKIVFLNFCEENVDEKHYAPIRMFQAVGKSLQKNKSIDRLNFAAAMQKIQECEITFEDIVRCYYEIEQNMKMEKKLTPEGKIPWWQVSLNQVPQDYINFYRENTPKLTPKFVEALSQILTRLNQLLIDCGRADSNLRKEIEKWMDQEKLNNLDPINYLKLTDDLQGILRKADIIASSLSKGYSTISGEQYPEWFKQCGVFYDRVLEHITKPEYIEELKKKLEWGEKEKVNMLKEVKDLLVDENGSLLISKNSLRTLGNYIKDYPFEEELRVFLNTMFGVANICSHGKNPEEDVRFLSLYGYESELYLIKVLVQLAQV